VVADFIIVGFGKDAAMLNTFDVLSGYTYVDHFDVYIGLSFGTCYGFADTRHSFVNIGHDTTVYASRLGFADSQQFDFVVAATTTYGNTNFSGTNVQSYDNWTFIFKFCHSWFHICCTLLYFILLAGTLSTNINC